MPPDKRRAPPGGSDASSKIIALDCGDRSEGRRPAPGRQARRRANFARNMVLESLGYRHARALDYDTFADRAPGPAPWW